MANAILKITTFRRNIRMGKTNRLDPILLKWDYSYLIQNKLRIFYLKSQIFSEDLSNYSFPNNILSNESFGFLQEDKEELKNINENIFSNEIIFDENKKDDDNDDTVEFISTILDNQLNLNNQLKSKYIININDFFYFY
jgi:hypothetical protein